MPEPASNVDSAPAEEVESAPAEVASPGKRRLKRSTRIGLAVIGALALLATAGFVAYYILDTRNYVTTDNAGFQKSASVRDLRGSATPSGHA